MSSPFGFNPWLYIWTSPKKTIQAIIDHNPNYRLGVLSAIYGFAGLLSLAQGGSIGFLLGFFPILIIAIILSPLWGYIVFSIFSYFIYFTGKWFKGQATYQQARASLAWANFPIIVNVIIWILLLIIYGPVLFKNFNHSIEPNTFNTIFLFTVMIIQFVASIWSLVIFISALAQVQKFSTWRSIFNIIVAAIILIVIMIIIALIVNAIKGS